MGFRHAVLLSAVLLHPAMVSCSSATSGLAEKEAAENKEIRKAIDLALTGPRNLREIHTGYRNLMHMSGPGKATVLHLDIAGHSLNRFFTDIAEIPEVFTSLPKWDFRFKYGIELEDRRSPQYCGRRFFELSFEQGCLVKPDALQALRIQRSSPTATEGDFIIDNDLFRARFCFESRFCGGQWRVTRLSLAPQTGSPLPQVPILEVPLGFAVNDEVASGLFAAMTGKKRLIEVRWAAEKLRDEAQVQEALAGNRISLALLPVLAQSVSAELDWKNSVDFDPPSMLLGSVGSLCLPEDVIGLSWQKTPSGYEGEMKIHNDRSQGRLVFELGPDASLKRLGIAKKGCKGFEGAMILLLP